jgi:hypothetical protein
MLRKSPEFVVVVWWKKAEYLEKRGVGEDLRAAPGRRAAVRGLGRPGIAGAINSARRGPVNRSMRHALAFHMPRAIHAKRVSTTVTI